MDPLWIAIKVLTILMLILLCILTVVLPIMIVTSRKRFRKKRELENSQEKPISVAFFHPYCNTGAGGERVLWCAIRAVQTMYPTCKVVIYTGDLEASPDEIINRVKQRLEIELPRPVEFIYLHQRGWVEAENYPTFTMLGQSLGSLVLGMEALNAFLPDVYLDTMGYSFTMPLFRYIGGCRVGCYTHYPTISTDMLRRVSSRTAQYNNCHSVARSPFLTGGKIIYYKFFAWVYGIMGRCAEIVMVNSSWTEEHINSIWNIPLKTHCVYPPCDTEELKKIPINDDEDFVASLQSDDKGDKEKKLIKIVSVGQFRPEKDHPLQLRAMYQLRQCVSEELWDRICLVFVGSCRGAADEARVKDMKDLCRHLSLENNVEFRVNVPYEDLKKELQEGTIGLHAMWNEHFGIGVVECMAAGLIMVAHRSGGPQMDIIIEEEGSRNGFLAADENEFAIAIVKILRMSPRDRRTIREAARSSVDRFSVKEFEKGFLRSTAPFFVPSLFQS